MIKIKSCAVLAFYKINDESYLIREQFSKILMTAISRPLITITIITKLIDLANRCGIMHKGVPIVYGFRKLFTTQVIILCPSNIFLISELTFDLGLTSCYYRPSIEGMYEACTKALDYLIINPVN